jgi:hypothetical protein
MLFCVCRFDLTLTASGAKRSLAVVRGTSSAGVPLLSFARSRLSVWHATTRHAHVCDDNVKKIRKARLCGWLVGEWVGVCLLGGVQVRVFCVCVRGW